MESTMIYSCLPAIRDHVRRRLHLWRWSGDHEEATLVANELVTNALHHGRLMNATMVLRLALLGDGALLIDVSDPLPAFPGFSVVRAPVADDEERGRGLLLIRGLGGTLSWFLRAEGGKTVRAQLPGAR
ncbi:MULTISPECIES: ATP-binding protein [unclassified Streptomyces]|uniref:ATP-binding protein n=1 Tax=unclassified Streptomyces TaxID=2593676 RepID=UPI000DBA101C|nr:MULTISPECIES: ATP-binding protein [unclassified Streptomyces]MYT68218.1 ATP-binding protein [Streptomyces sp. SID8367]RAJ76850.1 anti-sigma regulatory factor (Ser/Thr protein kinase) [Streptomyces sp. PsTaAH-137]